MAAGEEPLTHLPSSLFSWPWTENIADDTELSLVCWHPLFLLFLAMASGYKVLLLYSQMSSNSQTLLSNILTSKTCGKTLILANFNVGWGWNPFWFSHCRKMLCHWVYSRTAGQHSDWKPYMETSSGVPERKWDVSILRFFSNIPKFLLQCSYPQGSSQVLKDSRVS